MKAISLYYIPRPLYSKLLNIGAKLVVKENGKFIFGRIK
jgi:hypothetical protein